MFLISQVLLFCFFQLTTGLFNHEIDSMFGVVCNFVQVCFVPKALMQQLAHLHINKRSLHCAQMNGIEDRLA